MHLRCQHGYFMFYESKPGDISRFMSLFTGLELVAQAEYFTFSFLADAPRHSILGATYLGLTATKTFEGNPWDVMKENKLIYNFNKGRLELILTVTQRVKISTGVNYFLSDGLILPGSLTDEGKRVMNYSAWFSFDSGKFRYSEISYV